MNALKTDKSISSSTSAKASKSQSNITLKSFVKPWEFFSSANGIVSEFLNKQINIPSTAFTPNMVLPTKMAFTGILQAYKILDELQNKIKAISSVVDQNNSMRAKQTEYIKLAVAKAIKKRRH